MSDAKPAENSETSKQVKWSLKRKIVATITVILIALLLVLYWQGGKPIHSTTTISIAASPEVIFSAITDSDQAKQWIEGVVEIKPTTEGGFKKGAKAEILVIEQGREFKLNDEVIDFKTNEFVTFRIYSELFNCKQTYSLKTDPNNPDQTLVEFQDTLQHLGLSRILAPFVIGIIQEKYQQQLADLKNYIKEKQDK
jgi:carbon monoxide dehydrogenase subunit G